MDRDTLDDDIARMESKIRKAEVDYAGAKRTMEAAEATMERATKEAAEARRNLKALLEQKLKRVDAELELGMAP